MKIKTSSAREAPRHALGSKVKVALAIGAVVLAAGGMAGSFIAGIRYRKHIPDRLEDLGSNAHNLELADHVKRDLRTFVSNVRDEHPAVEVPQLVLDIKHKHVEKLRAKRDEALRIGTLDTAMDDFVPADLRYDGKVMQVELRLKGDWLDHLRGDKWSYRVKIKGEDHVMGVRVFSLQHPKTRGYVHDAMIQDHMRREGVMGVRHRIVQLIINGEDKGLMDMEEHFSKEMFAPMNQRDSVLFRFDESGLWETERLNPGRGLPSNFTAQYPIFTTFRTSAVLKSASLTQHMTAAQKLMRAYLEGKLSASEVFEPRPLARFMAVSEIWDQVHGLGWHNVRFAYNAFTGRIEPVAFDSVDDEPLGGGALLRVVDQGSRLEWVYRWLDDPRIRSVFVQELHRMAQEVAGGKVQAAARAKEAEMRAALIQEFPLIGKFDFGPMEARAHRLLEVTEENVRKLEREKLIFPYYVQALLTTPGEQGGKPTLDVANVLRHPVEVVRVVEAGAPGVAPRVISDRVVELAPMSWGKPVVPVSLDVDLTLTSTLSRVEVVARIKGQAHEKAVTAVPFPAAATRPVIEEPSLESQLAQHSFLKWNEAENTVVAEVGEFNVNGSIILPEGVNLRLLPGTTLRFGKAQKLVVRGAFDAGGDGAPVVLTAQGADVGEGRVCDDIESSACWQGLAVFRAPRPSAWKNVTVEHVSGVEQPGWYMTGAINWIESEINFVDCTFQQNQAEDILNTIRTRYSMKNVTMRVARSDAFDSDFCDGTIENGRFEDITGDAIDFGGSTGKVVNAKMERIGDKAISVGEGSSVELSHIEATDIGCGIAIKEGSSAILDTAVFANCTTAAVMSYLKKREFGHAKATVTNLKVNNCPMTDPAHPMPKYVNQLGNTMSVNGEAVEARDVNVEKLYSGGHMKKITVFPSLVRKKVQPQAVRSP